METHHAWDNEIVDWFSNREGEKCHYTEVAKGVGCTEEQANASCNRLFHRGVLTKPRAGQFLLPVPVNPAEDKDPEDASTPWDMSPVTADQTDYYHRLRESIDAKWLSLDTTLARQVLLYMNKARLAAGIGFVDYDS